MNMSSGTVATNAHTVCPLNRSDKWSRNTDLIINRESRNEGRKANTGDILPTTYPKYLNLWLNVGLRDQKPATKRMSYGVVMSKFRVRIQIMTHEITLLQLDTVDKEVANVKQKILICWSL